jgi:hypothetical protein
VQERHAVAVVGAVPGDGRGDRRDVLRDRPQVRHDDDPHAIQLLQRVEPGGVEKLLGGDGDDVARAAAVIECPRTAAATKDTPSGAGNRSVSPRQSGTLTASGDAPRVWRRNATVEVSTSAIT